MKYCISLVRRTNMVTGELHYIDTEPKVSVVERRPKRVNIYIKYIPNPDGLYVTPLHSIKVGGRIDLRVNRDYHLQAGDFELLNLGVAMELPEGYEAVVTPRSSTFNKYGIIQTNSEGVIDNTYCGDTDIWLMPVLAMRETHIPFNTRIAQFRIQEVQPDIDFITKEILGNKNRGGFGSTGER